jgi:hypothetical protein
VSRLGSEAGCLGMAMTAWQAARPETEGS